MKKVLCFGLLAIIFILLMLILGQPKFHRAKTETIKIGLLRVEDSLPFFVAEHDGLFAKDGINVELVTFNSARERDIALTTGEIQGELSDILAAALFKKNKTAVKIIALSLGSTPKEGRFAILSAPGSGITHLSQLPGVPVAVSFYTIIHYLAESMLLESGLSQEQIALHNIPDLSVRLECLLSGQEVKAALLPDPLATLAEKSGATVIVDDTGLDINLSQTVLIFREEALAQKPQEIAKLLSAYQEAAIRLNENPQAYQTLIIEKARIPKPLQDSYRLPHYPPLGLPTKEMVERILNWMYTQQLLTEPYCYEDLVSPDFLPQLD